MPLRLRWAAVGFAMLPWITMAAAAQSLNTEPAPPTARDRVWGPYNVHVQQGGVQRSRALPAASTQFQQLMPFSLSLWVNISEVTPADTLIAGVGNPSDEDSRFLGLSSHHPLVRFGVHAQLTGGKALGSGWHLIGVSFDGVQTRLYADGVEVASGALAVSPLAGSSEVSPRSPRNSPATELGPLLVIGPTHTRGGVVSALRRRGGGVYADSDGDRGASL